MVDTTTLEDLDAMALAEITPAAEDDGDSDKKEIVTGTDGDDSIDGTAVAERFILMGGNDTARGGSGDDAFIGGRGMDVMYGGAGNDEMGGTDGSDVIYGKGGADILDGGGRQGNYVDGGAGKDTITGGEGSDVVYGGTGRDLITAGKNADVVYFTPGDATGGGDTITDFLPGTDTLWMPGVDVTSFTQTTTYDPTTFDYVTKLSFSFLGSTETESVTLVGIGFPDSQGGDALLADFLAQNLVTASAFDPLGAQTSLDTSLPDLGFSQEEAEAGVDGGGEGGGGDHGGGGEGEGEVVVAAEDDGGDDSDAKTLVMGTDGNDSEVGTVDAERYIMLGGDDTVYGRGGDDAIIGGRGNDWLYGERGNDEIIGTDGADVIYGGAGKDTVDGGGRQGNYVDGGAGNDEVTGGEGADVIVGGTGREVITTGSGEDVIYFKAGDAVGGDTILDFKAGIDTLWIEGADLASFTQKTTYDPTTFDLTTKLTFSFVGSSETETITLVGLGFPNNKDPDARFAEFLADNVVTDSSFDPRGAQTSLDSSLAELGYSVEEAVAAVESGDEGEGGGGGHGGGGEGEGGMEASFASDWFAI